MASSAAAKTNAERRAPALLRANAGRPAEREWKVPPRPSITADVEFITPAQAWDWLNKGERPRKDRRVNVIRYYRDITSGQWVDGAGAVIFDKDGALLNGQHTLLALIESDEGLWLVVVRGVSPSALEVIDSGATRTFADVLRGRGEINVMGLGAAIRFCWLYTNDGLPWTSIQPTRSDLLSFLDKHPGIRDSVRIAHPLNSPPHSWPASSSAGVHYLASLEWPEQAAAFYAFMALDAEPPKGSPPMAFRRWLINNANEAKTIAWSAHAINAINAYVAGKTMNAIKGWTPDQKFPKLLTRRQVVGWPDQQEGDPDPAAVRASALASARERSAG